MEKQQNTAEAMLLHVRNTSAVSNSTLVEEPSSSAQPLQPPPATAPSPAVTLGSALQPPVVYGTLDQYAVGDVLGQGAFATVRVAVGLQTGRKVVVKSVRTDGPDARAQLFGIREALALAAIPSHPGVPALLDYARDDSAIHLVLALAPGCEVFSLINEREDLRLDEGHARRIVAGVLNVLRHVHAHGVLHRDIKMDNVLYEPETGTVSVIDFGLASFFDEATLMDEAIGCINYASPSILKLTNDRVAYLPKFGHQDLWALGVLAHGLLTGFFPFRSEDPLLLQKEIGPYGVRINMPHCSPEANQFIRILLDPRNEGRMSAGILLRHPWVAPFAPPEALADPNPRFRVPRMQLPSSAGDLVWAHRVAQGLLERTLPAYLRRLGAGLQKRTSLLPGIDRRGSEESIVTLGTPSEEVVEVVEARCVEGGGGKQQQQQRMNPGRWFGRILGR